MPDRATSVGNPVFDTIPNDPNLRVKRRACSRMAGPVPDRQRPAQQHGQRGSPWEFGTSQSRCADPTRLSAAFCPATIRSPRTGSSLSRRSASCFQESGWRSCRLSLIWNALPVPDFRPESRRWDRCCMDGPMGDEGPRIVLPTTTPPAATIGVAEPATSVTG